MLKFHPVVSPLMSCQVELASPEEECVKESEESKEQEDIDYAARPKPSSKEFTLLLF